jgi:hypothetical protein
MHPELACRRKAIDGRHEGVDDRGKRTFPAGHACSLAGAGRPEMARASNTHFLCYERNESAVGAARRALDQVLR